MKTQRKEKILVELALDKDIVQWIDEERVNSIGQEQNRSEFVNDVLTKVINVWFQESERI